MTETLERIDVTSCPHCEGMLQLVKVDDGISIRPVKTAKKTTNCGCNGHAFGCICECHGEINRAMYDLILEIEKLPASEQQTKVVIMAGDIRQKARKLHEIKL